VTLMTGPEGRRGRRESRGWSIAADLFSAQRPTLTICQLQRELVALNRDAHRRARIFRSDHLAVSSPVDRAPGRQRHRPE
jgi:hypothetical protein